MELRVLCQEIAYNRPYALHLRLLRHRDCHCRGAADHGFAAGELSRPHKVLVTRAVCVTIFAAIPEPVSLADVSPGRDHRALRAGLDCAGATTIPPGRAPGEKRGKEFHAEAVACRA